MQLPASWGGARELSVQSVVNPYPWPSPSLVYLKPLFFQRNNFNPTGWHPYAATSKAEKVNTGTRPQGQVKCI
jgi:hypothetical protein